MSNDDKTVPTLAEVMAHLRNMAEQMGEVKTDIKGIFRNQTEILQNLTMTTARTKDIEKDVSELTKIVRDGNGQPSLMHRLSAAETNLVTHGAEIDKLRTHFNAAETARTLSRGQIIAGIAGIVVTALLALASVLLTLFRG